VPRMTATQRDAIANPATGLTVFVTSDSSYYYFNGTDWAPLGVRAAALPDSTGLQNAAGMPDSVLYSAAMTSNPTYIEVVGDYAFVARFVVSSSIATYLDVYDLSDPANISKVAEEFVNGGFPNGMALVE